LKSHKNPKSMSAIYFNKKRRKAIQEDLKKMKAKERAGSAATDWGGALLVGAAGVGIGQLLGGWPSVWAGVAAAGVGAFLGEPLAITGGLVLAATGGMMPKDEDPEKKAGEKIADRFKRLGETLKENTGFNKLMTVVKKEPEHKEAQELETPIAPLGNTSVSEAFAALDEIETQLVASAMEHQQNNQNQGFEVSEDVPPNANFQDSDEPDFSQF